MVHPSRTLQVLCAFALPLLAAGALILSNGPVRALQSNLEPPQREWDYREYADVVTGDLYPATLLMSRKSDAVPPPARRLGDGYLSVGNYSKRPMEVTLSWDEAPPREPTVPCKPNGCQLSVRFGTSAPMKLVAVQHKHSPTLILQDTRALLAVATKHVGPIEIQVETLSYGLITLQFSTDKRLQIEKLTKR